MEWWWKFFFFRIITFIDRQCLRGRRFQAGRAGVPSTCMACSTRKVLSSFSSCHAMPCPCIHGMPTSVFFLLLFLLFLPFLLPPPPPSPLRPSCSKNRERGESYRHLGGMCMQHAFHMLRNIHMNGISMSSITPGWHGLPSSIYAYERYITYRFSFFFFLLLLLLQPPGVGCGVSQGQR